jgi:hypothetical protein
MSLRNLPENLKDIPLLTTPQKSAPGHLFHLPFPRHNGRNKLNDAGVALPDTLTQSSCSPTTKDEPLAH